MPERLKVLPETPGALPHTQESADVLKDLQTMATGLTSEQAKLRLEKFGRNEPPPSNRRNVILRFLAHFHNILIYVLVGSAAITFLLGHLVDTVVILAVVLANACIGFVQEGRAEKAMDAIHQMLAPKASVLRDGRRIAIDGAEVVPGDIVLLEAGDKPPADMRLIEAHGMKAQEAILTGESVAVDKEDIATDADAALGDQRGMVFGGTLITAGQGRGVVTATGTRTEIGRIGRMISEVETLSTPLVRQMDTFARWLTLFILAVAAILLAFGYFVAEYSFIDLFMAVIGLSVAAIPEGLPAVLTITLAIGVQSMARRNAIVRRLPAIETIGSVSVICTDKTGTLTRNEMVVTNVAVGSHCFDIQGDGYDPAGAIVCDGSEPIQTLPPTLRDLATVALCCNDATLEQRSGVWDVNGDPMEGALLSFAAKVLGPLDGARASWNRRDVLPFDAQRRFMATLDQSEAGARKVFVKGAPETLLSLCETQLDADGSALPIDPVAWSAIEDRFASAGCRVLAFASRPAHEGETCLTSQGFSGDLVFLGLVGLIDPPRKEAKHAIAACQNAGIAVKMITGDHAGTAAAIGKDIGLVHADNILSGAQIDKLDDTALSVAALQADIFARTNPEHKLRLVHALQAQGLTVAMTGDGVNDAPALKRADVGIAMGQKGSEAAKEAADIVLADDNFATIAAAVCEGRTVFDNIKKVISWLLPTSGGEALVVIVALLLGLTLPVSPIQILWINLITAITLGIALAFEPTEENTMFRPPRPRDAPILGGELVWHIALVSGLFLAGVFSIFTYAERQGYSVELAQTLALNTLVVMEIFHLFFVRNIYGTSLTWKAIQGTPTVWACVGAVSAAQLAATYVPGFQNVLGTAAVGLKDGLLIIGLGIALFVLLELEKQIALTLGARPKTTINRHRR
ncbi:HAD-IC family P-type ATPase [uncultured Ruegeria sp.]|uniref:HAD-IC family P-type ATPase n=1 Tax=uncultured Ruegeria sp. TaxID=259304 RepID=UPI0026032624|nr:HAD-IC family P-type ATPase [uncultured Ruegeria sp.]